MSADTTTLNTSNVNLLILTSSFPQKHESHEGGFIFDLAKRVNAHAVKPFVLCPHFRSAPFTEWWNPVEIFRFPYFFPSRFERLAYGSGMVYNIRNNPGTLILVLPYLSSAFVCSLSIIIKKQISLIHSHWFIPQGLIGALLHCLVGIPHIATIHGSDLNVIKKYPVLYPLCHFIGKKSDVITVNSRYMQQQLIDIIPECAKKIRIIPMGIDTEKYSSRTISALGRECHRKHIILNVGRLIDVKGTIYLIDAMSIVSRHFPDALLVIAGSGPEERSLLHRVQENGLNQKVKFLGTVRKDIIPFLYQSADVFVLPSINAEGKTEALGVVLLEAMTFGCPVIGSDVGGIPDIIQDGENGFLVPEQRPDILAEKIIQLLSDAELGARFRKAGFISVQKRFSWDTISQQFSEVYRQALNAHLLRN